jgi:hypothetical protein
MTSTPTLPTVNPYDFANPVDTKDMFVGRTKEIDEILYYLNHAAASRRSISLALLGDRAAGKTSLLNIIAIEATRLNLIPVRIDLNTSDATSPLAFWFKTFDAIFTALHNTVAPTGNGYLFGGVGGKTYNTYQDIIASYQPPPDTTFCPCEFPLHYARAMAAGNSNAQLTDTLIKRDLSRLSSEAGRPIILLFDECNVLSQHGPLLQSLRNTFMNLSGYMLVLTGTPDLFPVMNEVFSPIIRQFKRIAVAPFTTPTETLDVILSPLERLKATHIFPLLPTQVGASIPKQHWHRFCEQLRDIHALTAGKPYEIQLICHVMFKRVQLGKAKEMRLTHDVLDDVLRELEGVNTPERRSMITSVLALPDDLLRALSVLVKCGTSAGVDATLSAAHTVGRWRDDFIRLKNAIPKLVTAGILTAEGDTLRYNGDDYDKIFCKYAARSKHVALDFTPATPGEMINEHIMVAVISLIHHSDSESGYPYDNITTLLTSDNLIDSAKHSSLRDYICDPQRGCDLLSFVRRCPEFFSDVYKFCASKPTGAPRDMNLLSIRFSAGGHEWHGAYMVAHNSSSAGLSTRLRNTLDAMGTRSADTGASLIVSEVLLASCSFADLVPEATSSDCEGIASAHAANAVAMYLNNGNPSSAMEHIGYCLEVADHLSVKDAGNVAYILMTAGRHEDAGRILLPRCTESESSPLVLYNFGLSCLMREKFSDARVAIARANSLMTKAEAEGFMVLLSPQLRDGTIYLEEVWREENDWTEELVDADGLLAVMLDAGKLAESLEQPALGDGPGQ